MLKAVLIILSSFLALISCKNEDTEKKADIILSMALDYKCKISVYNHHYELECKKNNDLCISKEFSDSLEPI
jgi:hypothetical protein